ncbi:enolase C-terminal domain-like protein [Salinibacter ruber]|uniref:enolase C-terminal domain-like protein n=1 Tax=Salinibacter ruber TaxID=146919 RepID=UPI0021689646|nr:enolase C-terminal domain-like protein [Salinibacter ruber]MCS3702319.1 hypothetical protein [Salinibacter ruber]
MSIEVHDTDLRLANLETRLPFEFGVVTMTQVPHCVVSLLCRIEGEEVVGYAADHFPPKWLTKDPEQSLADEARAMREVVQRACEYAEEVRGKNVFTCWKKIYEAQRSWGRQTAHPTLLWAFGVTFVERALVDAYCRAKKTTFRDAVRTGQFGIQPGDVYPELEDVEPRSHLPDSPSTQIDVRHTVGHEAPLTGEVDVPEDGLPVTLEENVEYYGINKFKLKIAGDIDQDEERVRTILHLLDGICDDYRITLDANEQYSSVEELRALINSLRADAAISELGEKLLFVEQPFPRDIALSPRIGIKLKKWNERPPIIIDESDAHLDSCRTALDRGYAGTSHKNCKGVFKSIINKCFVEYKRQKEPEKSFILSAEDLTTIGPISLQQDLAVAGTLGISHVERNGHHFFRGLNAFCNDVQRAVLDAHEDLFVQHEEGFATLNVDDGVIALDSVLDAPFGYQFSEEVLNDVECFKGVAKWEPPV